MYWSKTVLITKRRKEGRKNMRSIKQVMTAEEADADVDDSKNAVRY